MKDSRAAVCGSGCRCCCVVAVAVLVVVVAVVVVVVVVVVGGVGVGPYAGNTPHADSETPGAVAGHTSVLKSFFVDRGLAPGIPEDIGVLLLDSCICFTVFVRCVFLCLMPPSPCSALLEPLPQRGGGGGSRARSLCAPRPRCVRGVL